MNAGLLALMLVSADTLPPLFAVSNYSRTRLVGDGWVRAPHSYAATGAAAIFGVNTVTGVWNAWDTRHDTEGRTRRLLHSALFIAAAAGVAWAGSKGEETRNNSAISSMGVSTVRWLLMLVGR